MSSSRGSEDMVVHIVSFSFMYVMSSVMPGEHKSTAEVTPALNLDRSHATKPPLATCSALHLGTSKSLTYEKW